MSSHSKSSDNIFDVHQLLLLRSEAKIACLKALLNVLLRKIVLMFECSSWQRISPFLPNDFIILLLKRYSNDLIAADHIIEREIFHRRRHQLYDDQMKHLM